MTIRDLLELRNVSIDVCDDYDERCYIAFEYGYTVTEHGAEVFEDALDIEVYPSEYDMGTWTAHCENGHDAQACRDFFYAIAGFVTEGVFDRCFKEVE